jgi:uncharacterized membrane protein
MRNLTKLILVCLIPISLFIIQSCQTEPDLTGVPDVKFSTDVQRILSAKCNFSGCHASSGGNGSLASYESVMSFGGIKVGNAHNSTLYRVITHRSSTTMPPKNYTEVSSEELKLIYLWIEQGAKNN